MRSFDVANNFKKYRGRENLQISGIIQFSRFGFNISVLQDYGQFTVNSKAFSVADKHKHGELQQPRVVRLKLVLCMRVFCRTLIVQDQQSLPNIYPTNVCSLLTVSLSFLTR